MSEPIKDDAISEPIKDSDLYLLVWQVFWFGVAVGELVGCVIMIFSMR